MLEAKKLCYSYNQDENKEKLVIDGVDLEIERGSFVAILGQNGSGKSTLAKHFNAILLPTGGKMYVMGMDTTDEDRLFDIRSMVGMVFQNPDNQIVTSIVEDEVAFATENLGVEPEQIRKCVDEALEIVGMSDYKLAAPSSLSGGQKQRIAIASALAMKPECIVLDEPTAMLDPKGRKEIIDTIRNLNCENNMTVVLITHYMDEAAKADRVIVMEKGRIVADDTPRNVFSKVEDIKKTGLDVPQVTELMFRLKNAGVKLENGVIGVDEAVDILCGILKGKGEI